MPQLPRDIGLPLVELVLELCVSLAQEPVEGRSVFDAIEVEWLARTENGRMFREIAVMRVI